MKILFLLLLTLAGGYTVSVYLDSEAPQRVPEDSTEELDEVVAAPQVLLDPAGAGEQLVVLRVENMCCLNCTGTLHAALTETGVVERAAVSFEQGLAWVVQTAGADSAPVLEVLNSDKYEAQLLEGAALESLEATTAANS